VTEEKDNQTKEHPEKYLEKEMEKADVRWKWQFRKVLAYAPLE